MKYCSKCNKQFNATGNFCPQCGNRLTEAASTVFCPNCGKKLTAGVKFCDGCGTGISDSMTNGTASNNVPARSGTPGRKKSSLIVPAVAVLLVAALAGAGFYFSKRYDKPIPQAFLTALGIGKTIAGDSNQKADVKPGNADGTKQSNANAQDGPQMRSGSPVAPPAPGQPANPQVNNAAPVVPPVSAGVIVNAYHSSADRENNYTHSALLAVDGNPSTCWSEGVPGYGIGENIVIHFNGTYKVSGMNIWVGHQKSEALFYQNARPRSVRVQGSDGSSEVYFLSDTLGVQRVNFRRPINTSLVKIIVDQVMPGNRYEDTCIAEVSFF